MDPSTAESLTHPAPLHIQRVRLDLRPLITATAVSSNPADPAALAPAAVSGEALPGRRIRFTVYGGFTRG